MSCPLDLPSPHTNSVQSPRSAARTTSWNSKRSRGCASGGIRPTARPDKTRSRTRRRRNAMIHLYAQYCTVSHRPSHPPPLRTLIAFHPFSRRFFAGPWNAKHSGRRRRTPNVVALASPVSDPRLFLELGVWKARSSPAHRRRHRCHQVLSPSCGLQLPTSCLADILAFGSLSTSRSPRRRARRGGAKPPARPLPRSHRAPICAARGSIVPPLLPAALSPAPYPFPSSSFSFPKRILQLQRRGSPQTFRLPP